MGIALTEEGDSKRNRIELVTDNTLQGKEHYTLKVDNKGISIKGSTEGALFWGLKTLDQLLMGDICNTAEQRIEHIYIDDNPRYGYRAVMIDPARHFLPVKDVKFFIDQMARFKFNTLQLHLTDDQGWRIEIKSHPKLTEIGASRNNGNTPQTVSSTHRLTLGYGSRPAAPFPPDNPLSKSQYRRFPRPAQAHWFPRQEYDIFCPTKRTLPESGAAAAS